MQPNTIQSFSVNGAMCIKLLTSVTTYHNTSQTKNLRPIEKYQLDNITVSNNIVWKWIQHIYYQSTLVWKSAGLQTSTAKCMIAII